MIKLVFLYDNTIIYNNTIIIDVCILVGEGCFGRDCHGVRRWSLQGADHQLTYLTSLGLPNNLR